MRTPGARCLRESPSERARDSTGCGADDGEAVSSQRHVTSLHRARGETGARDAGPPDRVESPTWGQPMPARCVRVDMPTKEPVVSEVTLEERGRALENQFYEKE